MAISAFMLLCGRNISRRQNARYENRKRYLQSSPHVPFIIIYQLKVRRLKIDKITLSSYY